MRLVAGALGAGIFLTLDVMALGLMLWSGDSSTFKYMFYAVWAIGVELLGQARDQGVPVPSGGMGTLSTGVNLALIVLNWVCYAALGFLVGVMLAGRPQQARR